MNKLNFRFKNDETLLDAQHLNQILDAMDEIIAELNKKISVTAATTELAKKLNAFVSGVDIKTVNGNKLLGSGNISI